MKSLCRKHVPKIMEMARNHEAKSLNLLKALQKSSMASLPAPTSTTSEFSTSLRGRKRRPSTEQRAPDSKRSRRAAGDAPPPSSLVQLTRRRSDDSIVSGGSRTSAGNTRAAEMMRLSTR